MSRWRKLFTVQSLRPDDYIAAAEMCARGGWVGGAIYDALHTRTAQAAECDAIWTFNARHFTRLAPEWAGRISRPLA